MQLELTLQAHCRYISEILGDNDRRELKDRGLIELTKILDPDELYFHVQGTNMIWRIASWRKDCEKQEELRKRAEIENAKLDARKQAYFDIAAGIQKKFYGLDLNLVYKLAESVVNDDNEGAAYFFTDGAVKLADVPKLPFPKYVNLDTGMKLTS